MKLLPLARCVLRGSGLSRNYNEEQQMNLRTTVITLGSRNMPVAPDLGAETQKQTGQGPYF